MKKRLDLLLVEKGFFNSRTNAQVHVLAGEVYVDNEKVIIASKLINLDAKINIKLIKDSFVSRGGLKLEKALNFHNIDIIIMN